MAPGLTIVGEDARLPQLLSASDVVRYRYIFELQQAEQWQEADWTVGWLENPLLVGHVLLQRYMHPKYRTSYGELLEWLEQYGDMPGADRVYRLALKRLPPGARPPAAPEEPDFGSLTAEPMPEVEDRIYVSRRRNPEDRRQITAAQGAVLDLIRAGDAGAAETALEDIEIKALLDVTEYDDMRRRVALAYYLAGQDEKAFDLAVAVAERSRAEVPMADWTAGLAAWRLGRTAAARRHFEALAHSGTASVWEVTAGAYWAARANLRSQRPEQVNRLLRIAAKHPRTFYGLLASRQLGLDVHFTWDLTPAQQRALQRLEQVPGVRRTIALSEIGQDALAGEEIRKLYVGADERLGGVLIALASRVKAPAAALRLGQHWRDARGRTFDAALYPLAHWEPESGFTVDRALVYAFIRQESKFDVQARSPAGAAGLMQLMPSTASFVVGDKSLDGANRDRLLTPEVNIDIGQRYLRRLLDGDPVRGNLVLLAAAYNAGPGTVKRWLKEVRYDNDPLLFIESMPQWETRTFVTRVLANFWIYRERLRQESPSLDALAAGNWPYYVASDEATLWVADYDAD